ncbi:menaquinone-dependent protoporphyrinogen IX dehydrogenase [Shewanella sp. SR43-4]|jgi:menaquinone-dependent protoporphyrinogen oxidase|uniref:menaquinone-dependent protoporphyrinogen IX dehydrogenase n=1 Tax=Shewanella TaxID=22 RepID=UPI000F4ED843|nr:MULTISPECIES: menaquinone-dependent protoporphyrinogen IX dehydrogenase [Shewanella]MBB1319463.1 menaquinone-dependent protoporphyrinogen IX dehydrogenase [Shewanella sp. SR43-4]MBB1323494.1 menaquinone-dependent protoporphyrinogen IX dehydrogenase [Shewanella sp. SR43-8]MBB1391313.1 menaquinone-dependent protoporphyrinogen IX dehydrogenase [Shewanella sp. SG44-6]MBB1477696.1 menaquinone-dependent protoporphyrinogen IX dehydrogenase [Shewanella sp. SG41-3]RPA50886.1 menaquinone-dependent pr|tara:strand:- start:3068 stop:3619 length:552 start_codon:yes stop_codon:yes gene_type:complete
MANILVLYYSRGGHTAHISRAIAEQIQSKGDHCDVVNLNDKIPIEWSKYQAVALGACVLYGSYHKSVFEFVRINQQHLSQLPNSFFCVNVVARKPEKRIPENNKYLQKFLTLSPWKPQDVKIIAGKVDYPSWPWYDSLMIRLIMKMTDGPTDPSAIIDYTDWEDVKVYADHIRHLASAAAVVA